MSTRDVISRTARQVKAHPHFVAVRCFDDEVWTYERLWMRSASYAAWVKSSGVGREEPVAVMLPRSAEAIAAILGVMRAGAMFVPLDASWPAQRVADLLATLGPTPIIDAPVADADFEADVHLERSDAAYAIFTSGSTGRPKAVVVEHGSLGAFTDAISATLEINAEDRVFQFASVSFDASLEEIIPALCAGATIALRSVELPDPQQLMDQVQHHEVTILDLPTAYWHQMVSEAVIVPPKVRWLIIGGEAASADAVKRWFTRPQSARLINTYGPTECTVTATGFVVEKPGETVPIGKSIGEVVARVVDEDTNTVQPGRPGWLYLGGPQVARGYANNAARTAEAFVPDPWGRPGSRMYDTGDMAAMDEAGNLVFLGRRDGQVKVRGHRVELGEIQQTLAEHPNTDEVFVEARADSTGQLSVVAWVTPAEADVASVRAFVAESLPSAMVPAFIVAVDKFVLTSSGKIDRGALPDPVKSAAAADFVEPSEELLASIWTAVLGISCGPNDDFFDLGGHSLHATQVVSRVRTTFGVEVALRDVFEARTVRALARRITAARSGQAGTNTITASDIDLDAVVLSVEQERLWFFERYQPGTNHYVIPAVARVRGPVDAERLRAALQSVVDRHDVLRSTFHERDGRAVGRICDDVRIPFEVIETPDASEVIASESNRHFDLEAGPLIRATLVRCASDDHVLIVAMHHIVCDGWSLGVLASEITESYSGRPVKALSLRYADFAVHQRRWIESEHASEQLDYWREVLKDAPVLELPTDRARPRVRTFTPQHMHFEIPEQLSQSLRLQARDRGATAFMVVLAALAVVMKRYTGLNDLVVGAPIAGRTSEQLEDLIGFFVNVILHRVDLSGSPSFTGLVERVRSRALDAYANQQIPFETLVAELQTVRDPSRSPLAQVMLVVHNANPAILDLPGCEPALLDSVTNAVPVDMTVDLTPDGEGYAGLVHYNGELFDAQRIQRFVGHLLSVLSDALRRPDAPIDSLHMLEVSERQQLINQGRQKIGEPRADSLQDLFAAQVQAGPDNVALRFGTVSLTYRELDEASSVLSGHLIEKGVTPGDLVAVCLERGVQLVTAMLAIIKSGAAYLPLDPAYPQPRLAFIASDAQARVLITQESLVARLPNLQTTIVVDAPVVQAASSVPQVRTGSAADMAYAIYTSGSTGIPKGIAIAQRGIVRLVRDTDYLQLKPSDRVAQASNASFDAATFEIWGPLLNGGQIVGVPTEVLVSASKLRDHLSSNGINVMFMTTALFNQMATELPSVFSQLDTLLFGGEASDASKVAAVLRAGGPKRLVHVYGPTEATTFATWHEVTSVSGDDQTIPIGQPIANTSCYLLDAQLRLVPDGVIGEICLGGPGLATGYLHRQALTAERFVPDPFSDSGVLYRTGDLARMRPGVGLEFLGRIDDQVKVRGFRIELAEVESALVCHPAVSDAIVIVREDASGDRRLAAYVAASKSVVTGSDLRRFVGHQLPAFMVPASVTVMDALPLNPNGKVDRRQLPPPAMIATTDDPPVTDIEKRLAEIWCEVLQLSHVGLHDDFFDLGGHSLLATRVASRIRDRFGVELTLRTIFDASTLTRLAPVVEAEIDAGRVKAVAAIPRRQR